MQVAIVRHDPKDHCGWIAPALQNAGLRWNYHDPGREKAPDALILLGGSGSANDPGLETEIALIRQAVADRVPVLGICLGAQLIAKALGCPVYRNRVPEIGWAPIRFTAEGKTDPLFHSLNEEETVFQWHSDTFRLPDGAALLASSAACENQAFRFGSNIYGFQFHLEATPDIIERWQQEDSACTTPELNQPVDPHASQDTMAQLAAAVFGRWASLVSSSVSPRAARSRS